MNLPAFRPEHRISAGRRLRARGLAGYVRVQETEHSFNVAWRWRNSRKWLSGSVATRDEAEALRGRIKESLERGEDPGELPHFDVRKVREPTALERSTTDIAAARKKMRTIMSTLERCDLCWMLKPCAPCIPDVRRDMRGARRASE